jgi:hypothetical protein
VIVPGPVNDWVFGLNQPPRQMTSDWWRARSALTTGRDAVTNWTGLSAASWRASSSVVVPASRAIAPERGTNCSAAAAMACLAVPLVIARIP